MKHIQTQIDQETYLKLKSFCDLTQTSIKDTLNRIISEFLSSTEVKEVNEYADKLSALGNSAIERINNDYISTTP